MPVNDDYMAHAFPFIERFDQCHGVALIGQSLSTVLLA
jgi:hypothetical protein